MSIHANNFNIKQATKINANKMQLLRSLNWRPFWKTR